MEVCWVCEQGKGDEPKTGKKRKSKGDTKTRRGKAKNTVESDIEEEEIPICESEDEADALPILAPPTFDAQDGIIDSSTPRKKRKLVAEVILSSPNPRKRVKISRSSSPDV